MRVGICSEVVAGRTLPAIARAAKEIGYEGLEVAPHQLGPDPCALGAGVREALRAAVRAAGLELVGLHRLLLAPPGLHLTHPNAEVRLRSYRYLAELAVLCRDLGGRVLVLGSPRQRDLLPGVRRSQARRWFLEGVQGILGALEATGIVLCLEPLPETAFVRTLAEAAGLVGEIRHPHLRLHLDVRSLAAEGGDLAAKARTYAPLLGHVHVQDASGRDPGAGAADVGAILRALAGAG